MKKRLCRLARVLLALFASLLHLCAAHALDAGKTISQYVHDSWTAENGFVGGAVNAICQSADGYLWIGTERGLVRFDGFSFRLLERPVSGAPALGAVRSLLSDADGNLWIRLNGPHLLVYRDGKFADAAARYRLEDVAYTAMTLDLHGHLLLWGIRSQTLRFEHDRFVRYAPSVNVPGIALSLLQTADGALWTGTTAVGLFSTQAGTLLGMAGSLSHGSVNAIAPAGTAGVWVGTDHGLYKNFGGGSPQPEHSPLLYGRQVLTLLRDRAGTLWAGTSEGLVRLNDTSAALVEPGRRGASAEVTAIYEDREGNIWFGGLRGIHRLRDGTFTRYGTAEGLPAASSGPVYVDDDGRTWFAPVTGGIYWLWKGRTGHVDADGLSHDVMYSISGGGGEIWLGREHGGLTRLTRSSSGFAAQTWTERDGLAQNSVYSVHRNRDGAVWAGTVSRGLSVLRSGSITDYPANADGPRSNAIFSIVEGSDGTMWFATPSGLESFAHGAWRNLSVAEGLPSSNVRSLLEDSHHTLWIATAAGLAALEGGRVHTFGASADPLREEIFGLAEDRSGSLWVVTSDHVLQLSGQALLRGVLRDSDVLSYGPEDGLPGVEGVRRDRSVVADKDGRIWLSLAHGLASTDPAAQARNAVPVRARVESIEAAGLLDDPADSLRLPAGTQSVIFHFDSTNLSTPERTLYRYRLEGSAGGWSDNLQARQVVFTNLGPGSYRFHILASQAAELWDGPETVVPFSIAPYVFQTRWFQLLCAFAACLLILAAYRWRMARWAHQLDQRFQDRLAERTRIAQELHDTLLQGVLSASLQLDLVEEKTPDSSPSKATLLRVLTLLRQVTEQSRSTLRGLRSAEHASLSIQAALSQLGEEFAGSGQPAFRVAVYGAPQPLHPAVRDDVYRIAREAVVNAFLHAQATQIEVEVHYASTRFRIVVRDDGCGIDAAVLQAGRDGHWGLAGMRERSQSIGSELRLRSRVSAGTEVELLIPRKIAFEPSPSRRGKLLLERWLPGGRSRKQA